MNWIAQVGHVALKDARHSRWLLLAYAALIAVGVASVEAHLALGPYETTTVGPPSNAAHTSGSTMLVESSVNMDMPELFVFFVPLSTAVVGLIIVASVLQADSPTRPTAFWASRPLAPSGVLGAKLLIAAVAICGLSLVGGGIAFASLGTTASVTARALAHAAVRYGEWLVVAMLIAALTDDIRAFVGVFVGIVVAAFGAGMLIEQGGGIALRPGAHTITVITLASACIGVALLAFVYRTHERGRWIWGSGASVAALMLWTATASTDSRELEPPTLASGPRIAIHAIDPDSWSKRQQLGVWLGVETTDSARLDFQGILRATTRGGSVVMPINVSPATAFAGRVLPPVGRPVHWIIDADSAGDAALLTNDLIATDRESLSHGVDSLAVDGTVTVSHPRILATLPLRNGAIATRDGRRIAIYGLTYGPTGAEVLVQASAIAGAGGYAEHNPSMTQKQWLQFAILNDARGEAMLITSKVTWREGTSSSASIVLPWMDLSNAFMRLASSGAGVLPDDAWYTNARLVVVEWTATGQYRASAAAAIR